MPRVFVSYRRSDSTGEAGRLADSFRSKVGDRFTFRDATGIPPGAAFDEVLALELGGTSVVLVIIGPQWLDELTRRAARPDVDYVRLEVATALARGIRVIPVLVRGAPIPPAAALTDDLRPLAGRQAFTLRDDAWSDDVDRLLDAIGRPYRPGLLAVRAVIALTVILIGTWCWVQWVAEDGVRDTGSVRGVVASAVALYGACEFLVWRARSGTRSDGGRA